MKNRITDAIKKLYYQIVLVPSSYGTAVSVEDWEAEYRNNEWRCLDFIDEMARYMVIVGYIQFAGERMDNRSLSLLDVGCGQCLLLKYLKTSDYGSYLGIDIAPTAIKKAQCYSGPKTKFIIADFVQWSQESSFDIIVFNEALYYAKKPHDTLLRYSSFLQKNGFLIVSMFRHRNHPVIEKVIQKDFTIVDSVEVKNVQKKVWRIVLLHPR